MGTFGVKRVSDEYFCPSTVQYEDVIWKIYLWKMLTFYNTLIFIVIKP